MNQQIIKLLKSKNIEDMDLGWELLISPQNLPKNLEDWHPYLDCFFNNNHHFFEIKIIPYLGGWGCFHNNEIYKSWRKTWK